MMIACRLLLEIHQHKTTSTFVFLLIELLKKSERTRTYSNVYIRMKNICAAATADDDILSAIVKRSKAIIRKKNIPIYC